MSYSRRQLEAFGEPFGDSATYRKADGGLILGGGGSSSPAPSSSTTQTQDLPDWAKGHAEATLNKGAALTDINQNPYQAYGGNRIAGFDPMQQQSFEGAKNMTVAPQIGQATAASLGAGLGGFGVANQATTGGFQNQVGGYMNPYLQMSLAPQLAEAQRQYGITGTQQQSAATQAGAFGGSREAIMAAENERNKNTAMNQIIGQGYNTAFGNAQNQYNQNLQNQLAGYGMANQAAGQLGNLGTSQYQQGMGINALQNQYGAQQQAQQQRGLDTAYQDFLTQKNYPYQQLSYMSNLIRGTPMGMNTQSQVYQAPPSTAQNLTALGLGAAGLSKLAASGGLMDSYANGGEVKTYAGDKDSVTSEDNTAEIISTLSPQQLQNALRNAQARGDDKTVMAIMERLDSLSKEASMDKGIAGAMPEQMADGVVNAAGGGILAFARAGAVSDPDAAVDSSGSEATDIASLIGGQRVLDPVLHKKISDRVYGLSEALIDRKGYNPDAAERGRYEKEYVNSMLRDVGPDPYAPQQAYLDQKAAKQGQIRNRAEGAALLQAIPLVLQGNNLARGLGAGAGKIGASMAEIEQAQQVAEDHMAQARLSLASMQRNEKMGLRKEARADYASLQQNLIAADKNDILGKTNAANVLNNLAKSNVVRTAAGAGGAGKIPKLQEQLAAAEIAFEKDPSDENTKVVTALRRAIAQAKTTDVGKTKADLTREQIAAGETKEVRNAMKAFAFNPDYIEARQADSERADALWNAEIERQRNMDPNRTTPSPGPVGGGGGGGGSAPPPPPGFKRQ